MEILLILFLAPLVLVAGIGLVRAMVSPGFWAIIAMFVLLFIYVSLP